MKIEIDLISLKNEKIISRKTSYLQLNNDHCIYEIDYESEILKDKDDSALGFTTGRVFYKAVFKKECISAVDTQFLHSGRISITLSVMGNKDDIDIFFPAKKEVEARLLHDTIIEWLFSK